MDGELTRIHLIQNNFILDKESHIKWRYKDTDITGNFSELNGTFYFHNFSQPVTRYYDLVYLIYLIEYKAK